MARHQREHEDEPDPATLDLERGLPPKEVGGIIGAAEITLAQWRLKGEGPPWYRCGRRAIRYRLGDVLAWRDSRTVGRRP